MQSFSSWNIWEKKLSDGAITYPKLRFQFYRRHSWKNYICMVKGEISLIGQTIQRYDCTLTLWM